MKLFVLLVTIGLAANVLAYPKRFRRDVDEVQFGTGEDEVAVVAVVEDEDTDIRNRHHRPYGGQNYYSYNRPSYSSGSSYNRPQYGHNTSPYYQNNFGTSHGGAGYNSIGSGYNSAGSGYNSGYGGASGGYNSGYGSNSYGGSNTGYNGGASNGYNSYGGSTGNGYGSNLGGYYSNYGSGSGYSSYGRR